MEHEDEIDGEVHQVVTEAESGNERLQINIDHNEHRGAVETAAEGEEGDIEVDRFFLRVCRIIDSVLRLGSLPTTEINSELHGSLEQPGTGEGSIDSVASLSPSHTADTLVPTGSVSTAGASLEFLEMLPVVKTTDLPEEFRKCTICNESLGDGESPEVPVRLPCRHVFGKRCMSKWIANNSCPLCRAAIFPAITASALASDGTPPVPGRGELPYATRAEREEVRGLVGQVRDLANQHIGIAEIRISARARLSRSPRPPSEEMRISDEVYTRVNVALTDTMATLQARYLSRRWNRRT